MLDGRNSGSEPQGSDYTRLENSSQNDGFSNNDQQQYSSPDMDDEIPF
jgi:hypothetical protein